MLPDWFIFVTLFLFWASPDRFRALTMPVPTWLPPLVTNNGYIINIDADECPPPHSFDLSGFLINTNVTITYISKDMRVSTDELTGLSLWLSFHLPSNQVDISTPLSLIHSKEIINRILSLMTIPFPIHEFFWGATRLDGLFPPSTFFGATDIEGLILKYLVELRGSDSPSQSQSQLIAVDLTINKKALVPDEDFRAWIRWYNMNKEIDPNFEADYHDAISRPWTCGAAFNEVMAVRGVRLLIDNVIVGEEFNGDQDPELTCPICFERFAMGSRVSRLPCNHVYHRICMARWWIRSNLCPLCRRVL